ncbi:hypothetical protein LOZ64_000547 [Ophidiomyces ophidiicola]|uniref:uncharacterized protein n=1 Tax=Ophidiomyces ophidiicola TaxID=1387563 RepID=UPI0020C4946D|nr:uncharacterized protein LOZ57_000659 [Ophidiomyces ophidiicola]KAI1924671.1 hypothetical protein LOZ64_000547 [Ophidiomyces ophidiicola]KAI1952581.1 hypothetical protein LOZ57_000659 [Ophidiomyces ophidiicola]KAI2000574.1 hypothetical protein LOZ49_006692 [Ophidiomyces ophidiicola]KAI2016441.1 hypothetical protein LOZ46_004973 [Ophidiomyces ophidiicola]KAI2053710.1 hypothetical protein LOZ43_004199 [Ophidiomyces ophidiicola]
MAPVMILLWLFAVLPIALANHVGQQPLQSLFPGSWDVEFQPKVSEGCSISHLTAYEEVNGPVAFSTSTIEHPEVPKLSAVNSTAWEQWEFDATGDDGMTGLIIGFSRDASYAFFGLGNLRVEFYMVLHDGTVIQELDYLQESRLINCDGAVTGIWNSSRRQYSFEISKDMKQATVKWQTPIVQGNMSLSSTVMPHFPDGSSWPSSNATTEISPSLHSFNSILSGRAEAHVTLANRKTMRLRGAGGHSRLWAEGGWFKIVDGFNIVRFHGGPYTGSFWRTISRLVKGAVYDSAQLFKNGKLLIATRLGEESQNTDYVLFSSDFSGNVSGGLGDKSTGRILQFISPAQGKGWRFHLENKRKKFELSLGGHFGLTGFLNSVVGGEINGKRYAGVGFSEQVVFPEVIARWRLWIVYGIGYLNRGKGILMTVVQRFT